jgi:hypothetical protein
MHRAEKPFDLVHLDLWISPIVSVSGYKYYLVILDDCTHYLWMFPLKLTSDTFIILSNFFAYEKQSYPKQRLMIIWKKPSNSLNSTWKIKYMAEHCK